MTQISRQTNKSKGSTKRVKHALHIKAARREMHQNQLRMKIQRKKQEEQRQKKPSKNALEIPMKQRWARLMWLSRVSTKLCEPTEARLHSDCSTQLEAFEQCGKPVSQRANLSLASSLKLNATHVF